MIRTQQNNHRCFTEKPPIGTGIDLWHPLSSGLVGCWLFNEGGGKIANATTGSSLTLGSNTESQFNSAGVVIAGTTGTMAFKSVANVNTALGSFFLKIAPTTASTSTSQKWLLGGNTNCITLIKSSTSNKLNVYMDGRDALFDVVFSAGIPIFLVSVWNKPANNIDLYLNGIKCNRSSISGSFGNTVLTSLAIGSSNSGSNCYAGTYIAAALYNRALSADEIKALHENPYQICLAPPAPDQAIIDVPKKYRGGRR